MYNLQRMKIMKKILIATLAFFGIFAVSCNKEVEAPVAPEENTVAVHKQTIIATIGSETRTAYADFQKFSWKAGDKVDILTYNESTEYFRIATFAAQEDGKTTVFEGDVEDGYNLVNLAVYPDRAGYIQDDLAVYLPNAFFVDSTEEDYYTVSSENPLENLALVGRLNDEKDAYAFKTAMGAVKVTLTNLSSEARFLRIYAPEKISGYFFIDDNDCLSNESAVPGTFTASDGSTLNYSGNNIWYHFTPAADGSVTLYIPLPVGKLSAGTTFYVENEDEDVLYQRTTQKDIIVERNKVTELTALSAQASWKSLGTGKFIDNYNWYIAKFTEGTYVDVEIQADESDPSHFRLVKPYDAAFKAFDYSAPRGTTKPTEYFDLFIDNDGYVDYPQICTGIYYSGYKEATCLLSPTMAYSNPSTLGFNIVAKYNADGKTPANILLAPAYYWPKSGYWTGDSYFNSPEEIQIIFPGEKEAVDFTYSATYKELVDDSVEQPVALVDVKFGKSIAQAKLVIAADLDAAKAAVAAGNFSGTATEAGVTEALLPADAASGNYYIYIVPVPADGIAPAVGSMILESETPFQYIRSDSEDITVADVVGTYTAKSTYVLFNKPYWDAINAGEEDPEENEDDLTWYGGFTVSFTLEESDDEGMGDVMMTAFTENAVDYCPIETPIYATLDPKTGSISFAPMQPIYSITNDNGEVVEVQIANANGFKAYPVEFELSLDKTTYTSKQFFGYVLYFTSQQGFSYPDIWFSPTNVPMKLVKESASSAPALNRAFTKSTKKQPKGKIEKAQFVTSVKERPLKNSDVR